MNKFDPGFIKFRAETVAPELRNWRNLLCHWNSYQRYLRALKYNWQGNPMSDDTIREAMREMGQQSDPVREALRRMLAEFGDQHYHTCPVDNDSGPCNCFAGFLIRDAFAALTLAK